VKVTEASNPSAIESISPQGRKFTFSSTTPLLKGDFVSIRQQDNSFVFDRLIEDKTWSDHCRDTIGYFVAKGASSRAHCQGCFRHFDRDELRVKTKLKIGGVSPRIAEISLCFSIQCITKAINRYDATVRVGSNRSC
jgi:hypothetical protein